MSRAQVRSYQSAQIAKLASNGKVEVHVQIVLPSNQAHGAQELSQRREYLIHRQ
jgi:hypothetical protein